MKFGSLFTGIGGFDLGFERAGMSCAWQVEIDEQCRDVLNYHWPDVIKHKDVRNVKQLEAVDVICGGFPCQDVSTAGNREGLDGERSRLWYEFHRIIGELHPRWVVVENVPGLLSSNDGIDFAVVIGGLAGRIPAVPDGGWKSAGFVRGRADAYGVAWRVLDSQYFGVAQRRRRVFIVASAGNGRAAEILFECSCLRGNLEASAKEKQVVAGTISTRTGRGGQQEARVNQLVVGTRDVAQCLTSNYAKNPDNSDTSLGPTLAIVASRISNAVPTKARFDPTVETFAIVRHRTMADSYPISPTLESNNGGNVPAVCGALRASGGGPDDNAAQASHIVIGTLAASGAGTARTGNGNEGDMMIPLNIGARRLTPLECERLQGFPDGWTMVKTDYINPAEREFIEYLQKLCLEILNKKLTAKKTRRVMSDSARYKMLGNAVTVPVIEWIGRRIMAVERLRSR